MKSIQDIAFLFPHTPHWIDVRAPVEFASGAMPGAVNLPLLIDEERHEIGIVYKNQGQEAAIELGHRLVSGDTKEERIEAWVEEIRRYPGAVIYCFRGGLRSQTTQAWLQERGVDCPIVAGGYKALRRFLLDSLEKLAPKMKFRVVAGPTGSGKTPFLRASGKPYLDLEFLANHRGSAFGSLGAQPCQADFENRLALDLLKLRGSEEILVEDESRLIGRCHLPDSLVRAMAASPVIRLEVPLEKRVDNILRDYVSASDPDCFGRFRASVSAISRKLGGQRAQEILADIQDAESAFREKGDLEPNREWIRKLLVWYYDPLYGFSLAKRPNQDPA